MVSLFVDVEWVTSVLFEAAAIRPKNLCQSCASQGKALWSQGKLDHFYSKWTKMPKTMCLKQYHPETRSHKTESEDSLCKAATMSLCYIK